MLVGYTIALLYHWDNYCNLSWYINCLHRWSIPSKPQIYILNPIVKKKKYPIIDINDTSDIDKDKDFYITTNRRGLDVI